MPGQATISWLKFASTVIIGFGLAVALAAHPATSGLIYPLTDLIIWPFDGTQNLTAPETRLMNAITGGVMAGWGIMLWTMSAHGFQSDPALARRAILTSIITWFTIDSSASIAAGAPVNALLNLSFLLAFVVPLWKPANTVMA
jgi:hypothetical protein